MSYELKFLGPTLIHHQDTPETNFAGLHVLNRILDLVKRKLLNQTVDILMQRKRHSLFGVESVTCRPAMNRRSLCHKLDGIHRDVPHSFKKSVQQFNRRISQHLPARIKSFPLGPNPPTNGPITAGLGAVTMIQLAPPIFCSASEASSLLVLIYSFAPSCLANSLFESFVDSATVRNPILRAYWIAKCPSPPIPWIATTSPAVMFMLRREL